MDPTNSHVTSLRGVLACLAALLFLVAAPECAAQEDSTHSGRPELPGFYQFYLKAGGMKLLRPEAQRNRLVESGSLKPIKLDKPAPDIALPRSGGGEYRVRGLVGRKNLLVVTFRTWW